MVNRFRFSRKNRHIFKTALCQNNEKFREREKKRAYFRFTKVYQHSRVVKFHFPLNFFAKISLENLKKKKQKSDQNYRSFDEREEDRKGKSCFSMILKVERGKKKFSLIFPAQSIYFRNWKKIEKKNRKSLKFFRFFFFDFLSYHLHRRL